MHGHRDVEKYSLRTDAAAISHFGFRLIYSLSMIYGIKLGKINIKGAFNQSEGEREKSILDRPLKLK